MLDVTEAGGAITFRVRVAPRASRSAIAGVYGGALKVRVAAPPIEGAANDELTRFLARALGVPARAIEIVSGHASKTKVVRVAGAAAEQLSRLIEGA